jgi:hypothetical protein
MRELKDLGKESRAEMRAGAVHSIIYRQQSVPAGRHELWITASGELECRMSRSNIVSRGMMMQI